MEQDIREKVFSKEEIIDYLHKNPCHDGKIVFDQDVIRCDDCDIILAYYNSNLHGYLLF
jgi:hypothetical protein